MVMVAILLAGDVLRARVVAVAAEDSSAVETGGTGLSVRMPGNREALLSDGSDLSAMFGAVTDAWWGWSFGFGFG